MKEIIISILQLVSLSNHPHQRVRSQQPIKNATTIGERQQKKFDTITHNMRFSLTFFFCASVSNASDKKYETDLDLRDGAEIFLGLISR